MTTKTSRFFLLFFTFLLGCSGGGYAQVALRTVVEHFSNTNCSICASRNPGFYSNFNQQSNMLHLSIHPSAPYSSCLLSQQNPIDNDARTNYYGVYGGTPRLVINGTAIDPAVNYGNPAMFTPFIGLTSSFSLTVQQTNIGTDSIRATVTIKRVAGTATNTNARLFVGLAEDTVWHTGTNNEQRHFDVLRHAVFAPEGQSLTLPAAVGDSLLFTRTTKSRSFWNFNRMYVVAILQDETTKSVLQSERSVLPMSPLVLAPTPAAVQLFPQPCTDGLLQIKGWDGVFDYQLWDITGRLAAEGNGYYPPTLQLPPLADGLYLLRLRHQNKEVTQKISLQGSL